MIKKIGRLCSLLLAAAALFGCAAPAPSDSVGKPMVVTSFYPMYDFAQKATGGLAQVHCMVPDGTEPHDWEPTPRDMADVLNADVFFYSGAGFEPWVDTVLSASESEGLMIVETTDGLALIEDGHFGADPHTWLSPKNAKLQMKAMCDALAQADPAHAEEYAENYAYWAAEFDRLDEEFAALRTLPNNKIVVAHEAFGYLCHEYGLEQISARGLSPDEEPDPLRMAEVVSIVRENEIRVVFFEELTSPKVAEAIARETGAEVAVLSPLEGLSDKQREAGDDYFSVMRQNLAALKKALA